MPASVMLIVVSNSKHAVPLILPYPLALHFFCTYQLYDDNVQLFLLMWEVQGSILFFIMSVLLQRLIVYVLSASPISCFLLHSPVVIC